MESEYDISCEDLDKALLGLRSRIVGVGRVVVVVVLMDGKLLSSYVHVGEIKALPGTKDPAFAKTLQQLKDQYDMAAVVPVIVHHKPPETTGLAGKKLASKKPTAKPFVGLKLAGPPWASPEGEWCASCGQRSTGEHKC
jgi:hypothetical protein